MAIKQISVNGRKAVVAGRRATIFIASGAVFVAPAGGAWLYLSSVQAGMNRSPAWEQSFYAACYQRDGEGSYSYTGDPNTGGSAINEYSVEATQIYFDIPSGFGGTGIVNISIVSADSGQIFYNQDIDQANRPDNPTGLSFASQLLPLGHYLVRISRISGIVIYDGIGIKR